MTLNRRILRHPARAELLAYAEHLLGNAPVNAAVASHVRECPRCTGEVRAMRESLGFVHNAGQLEPTSELTGRILTAARKERRHHVIQRPLLWTAFRATACFTALAAAAVFTFGVFLKDSPPAQPADMRIEETHTAMAQPERTPEDIRRTAEKIRTLAAAVNTDKHQPRSLEELEQFRAVSALDRDLNAALSALKRNPGCTRAASMVFANLERQAEALRNLYVEREL